MTVTKELLLKNLKETIQLCDECLKTFVQVFNWHSRHANHHLSFIPFYKDYGKWQAAIEELPLFVSINDPIDNQIKANTELCMQGMNLYQRALNALSEEEVTNAFEKGPADLFVKCGKFEGKIELVRKLEKALNIALLPTSNNEVINNQKH